MKDRDWTAAWCLHVGPQLARLGVTSVIAFHFDRRPRTPTRLSPHWQHLSLKLRARVTHRLNSTLSCLRHQVRLVGGLSRQQPTQPLVGFFTIARAAPLCHDPYLTSPGDKDSIIAVP